jgi:hypothetical protein
VSLCATSLWLSVSLEHNNVKLVTIQSLYVLCLYDELIIFVLCTSTYLLNMFVFLNNLNDHESYGLIIQFYSGIFRVYSELSYVTTESALMAI